MDNYTIRAATEADLPAITKLANQYVLDNLSEEDRASGFLTGRFDLPAMRKLVGSATSIVAQNNQEVIGFIINSKLPAADYPPLVQHIILKLPELYYQGLPLSAYSYFFYGPVLVSKAHRGKGLLLKMFRKTQEWLLGQYEVGVAFIHEQNLHSLKVHTKPLGLEVVGQLNLNSENYYILAFSVFK